jgi:RNA polymerase subunit RPABC4/transcription elongation factor Spt4
MSDSTGGFDAGLLLAVYGGVTLITLWVAMTLWTYRDMRARSRDVLATMLVTAIVLVLNVPGLLIYLLLRPRETLAEAYERSLEEEALLQEIEEKPTCPGCGQRVQGDWLVCAHCHTRLKKSCMRCGKTLEMAWNICPYCAAPQAVVAVDEVLSSRSAVPVAESARAPMAEQRARRRAARDAGTGSRPADAASSLEFVDGD